ncbi:MAG: methyltransferase [Ideonella sp.]
MISAHGVTAATRWSGWVDKGLAWRDRLLASPLFQRRAAAFVLTRPVARRHARELFDLVAGFVYSQILSACVQLRLFELLSEGPQTCEQLAERTGLTVEAARRLLDAAVALRLLEHRSGQRFGLGELGAPMVGNTAVREMIRHHAALYADLADPVGLLRTPEAERQHSALGRYWAYGAAAQSDRPPDPRVGAYSSLMAASQPLVADEVLDAYSLRGHRCLLDIGGGDGSFLASAQRRSAALQLMLFDLPAVAERGRARLAAAGLAGRSTVHGGDFLRDALPRGADIASLIRVLHDHDDGPAMQLLRAVRAALPADGTLLLAEPMAGTPGAEAMGDAYFGFYLLAMGRGRPRKVTELVAMLKAAGFAGARLIPTRLPLQTQLLLARCK